MLRDADIFTRPISQDEAEGEEYRFEPELDEGSRVNTARFRSLLAAAIEKQGHLLQSLMAPMSAGQFVAERWAERATLFQNAHNRQFLPTLLSIAGLKAGLAANRYRREDYRFVLDQRYHADDGFYSAAGQGTIDAAQIERFVTELGGSIVIDDCHRYHEPLNDLWQELTALFRFPVTCTVYFTPAGQMTFPSHWDTDDVFVLQLEGRKCWSVYEPIIRDPLEHHQWGKYRYELGPSVLDVTLEPGDVLYVPRGHPHAVVAHPDAASLHITLGICLPTWHMCLKLLLEKVLLRCGQQARFRQPCPIMLETTPSGAPDQYLEGLVAEWRGQLTAQALRETVEDFMIRQVLWGTTEAELAPPLPDAPATARCPRYVRRPRFFVLNRTAAGLELKFASKALIFPPATELAVRHLTEAASVEADALPGDLNPEERQILLQRLEREGFLTTAAPERWPSTARS